MTLRIRPETVGDQQAIRIVHEQAFDTPNEAHLVDLLRKAGKATVSLVAVQNESIVGHILFSPVTIENSSPNLVALGLAPLAVLPEFQNSGIGSKLVREGLKICISNGWDIVVVLGHPTYYPRFGFSKASNYKLTNEYGVDDPFMALEMTERALSRVSRLVKYASEFGVVGT